MSANDTSTIPVLTTRAMADPCSRARPEGLPATEESGPLIDGLDNLFRVEVVRANLGVKVASGQGIQRSALNVRRFGREGSRAQASRPERQCNSRYSATST